MLILGPYTSWKIWNTQRTRVLDALSSGGSISDAINPLWHDSLGLSEKEIKYCESMFGNFDVVLPRHSNKRSLSNHLQVTSKNTFPPGSLIQVSSHVYALAPEMIFVMLSPYLDVISLIRLGLRLCASFQAEKEIDYSSKRLTSAVQLRQFIEFCPQRTGIKKARRALSYVVDNIHSIPEEQLYLQLCLPRLLGGYGFRGGIPNMLITVDSSAEWRYRRGDICWPKKRLCVEYDSTEFHGQYADLQRDSIRRTELLNRGYAVLSITNKQLYRVQYFRAFADSVAKVLGKRVMYTSEFYQRQMALRQAVNKEFRLEISH